MVEGIQVKPANTTSEVGTKISGKRFFFLQTENGQKRAEAVDHNSWAWSAVASWQMKLPAQSAANALLQRQEYCLLFGNHDLLQQEAYVFVLLLTCTITILMPTCCKRAKSSIILEL